MLKRGGMHLYTNVDSGGEYTLYVEHKGIDLIQDGKKILDTGGLGMPIGSWLGYGISGMNVPRAVTIEQLMETIAYMSNTFVDGITRSLEQAGVKVDA